MSSLATTKIHIGKEEEYTEPTSRFRTSRDEGGEQYTELADRITAHPGLIAEIKGLASLKDGAYSVDFENTVENMAQIIQNMESQLDQVLSLNLVLKNDLDASKEIIAENKAERSKFEEKIRQLQSEMPTKRELQMEIDQLIDDRSDAQNRIHELNVQCKRLADEINEFRNQLAQLEMKNEDAVAEINFLESRQNAAREQNNSLQQRINQLKQEKVSYQRKIIALQEECQRSMEEKYSLLSELRESQEIIKELRAAGVDRGMQAKWSR